MKDSRIGSFGAIGLICLLGLKYLSFHSIGEIAKINYSSFDASIKCVSCFVSPILVNKCAALLLMPVVGRWAQVCAAGLSQYARSESGTGSFISGRNYTKTRDLCIAPSGILVLVFLRPEWIHNICNNYHFHPGLDLVY